MSVLDESLSFACPDDCCRTGVDSFGKCVRQKETQTSRKALFALDLKPMVRGIPARLDPKNCTESRIRPARLNCPRSRRGLVDPIQQHKPSPFTPHVTDINENIPGQVALKV